MARQKKGGGFWLFEMISRAWRRIVRFFKKSYSPEELVESIEEKIEAAGDDAYGAGVATLKGRKKVVAHVGNLEALIDRFDAERKRAVQEGRIPAARLADGKIRLYQPMLVKARKQLDGMLDTPAIQQVAEFNIARLRWKLAQAEGRVAEISMIELSKGQAEFQEELLGIGKSRLDLWELDELEDRVGEMDEIEARLELSTAMLESGALAVDEQASAVFGPPSEELLALMQEHGTGELTVEGNDKAALAGLNDSLLELDPEK